MGETGQGRKWMGGRALRVIVPAVLLLVAALAAVARGNSVARPAAPHAQSAAATANPIPPPIRHVFIIVLENESASTTFGTNSKAPYLANTLRSEGAYLPNYYGIGHHSNDNYIGMIAGQPPNTNTQSDCQFFVNFPAAATGPYGAEEGDGCVYPANIQTIAGQLDSAHRTWRDYNEDMGNTPSREASVCGHPAIGAHDGTQTATASDQYATRHNPFVYFHSIIDNTALCDKGVVSLAPLTHDLSRAKYTPNYVFITPNLCHDGHDAPCKDGEPGGLTSANSFLEKWVPKITHSAAFRDQNGLLLITFDEAASSDSTSCCGEIAGPATPEPGITGPGGGDVGAVLLSPCIKPGTVSEQPYNHYSMLGSVEDIFGLSHIGYAQLAGEQPFGSDVYTRTCNAPPSVSVTAPRKVTTSGTSASFTVRWHSSSPGATYTVQDRAGSGAWHTLRRNTSGRRLSFRGRAGHTYDFRVRATSGIGIKGSWRSRAVRVIHG